MIRHRLLQLRILEGSHFSAFYLDFARISIFQQFELELYHFGFGNLVVKVISFTSSHSII